MASHAAAAQPERAWRRLHGTCNSIMDKGARQGMSPDMDAITEERCSWAQSASLPACFCTWQAQGSCSRAAQAAPQRAPKCWSLIWPRRPHPSGAAAAAAQRRSAPRPLLAQLAHSVPPPDQARQPLRGPAAAASELCWVGAPRPGGPWQLQLGGAAPACGMGWVSSAAAAHRPGLSDSLHAPVPAAPVTPAVPFTPQVRMLAGTQGMGSRGPHGHPRSLRCFKTGTMYVDLAALGCRQGDRSTTCCCQGLRLRGRRVGDATACPAARGGCPAAARAGDPCGVHAMRGLCGRTGEGLRQGAGALKSESAGGSLWGEVRAR